MKCKTNPDIGRVIVRILITFTQILYLSFDIVELKTGKIKFGIIASSLMVGLGCIALGLNIYETKKYGDLDWNNTIEALVYIVFGSIILFLSIRQKRFIVANIPVNL
jgi:hypothetical protein